MQTKGQQEDSKKLFVALQVIMYTGILKYESGVHCMHVFLLPKHKDVFILAASVAVLPEAEESDVVINEGEIKWDTFRKWWCRWTECK